MTSTFKRRLGAMAFALLLSACGGGQEMAPDAPGPAATWSALTSMQMMLKSGMLRSPLPSDDVLADESDLRTTLVGFGGNSNPGNLGALIAEIRASNNSTGTPVPGLTGLGGVHGRAFLDLAQRALDAQGNYNGAQRVVTGLSGKIVDYAFMEDGTSGRGNGRLEVITYISSVVIPKGFGTPGPVLTEAYKWTVTVENNGFQIVPKDMSDPLDPFPGTMRFTQEILDRIAERGYMFKLWARGVDINIIDVARKAGASGMFVTLPRSAPMYAKLYERIPDNCIDMLFVNRPPPTLSGLGPPFYCLGRCENPMIVNTGI